MTLDLPPLPPQMASRPFGKDEAGRQIKRVRGDLVRGTLEYTSKWVAQHTALTLSTELNAVEREQRIKQAQMSALNNVVARLNAAITDPIYKITLDYLMRDGNSYSGEFDLFFSEYCRECTTDEHFHFNRGAQSIPKAVLPLIRPLSLEQVYNLLPRFTAKFVDTDIRVVSAISNSAVLQWRFSREVSLMQTGLHRRYMWLCCQYAQGSFSNLPQVHSGLAPAQVVEQKCVLWGDECCEWKFTWQETEKRGLFGWLR